MRLIRFLIPAVLVVAAGIAIAQYGHGDKQGQDTKHTMTARAMTSTQADFQDAMRKLWEDHVTWTRLFIVSAAANLPDKQATTERLLQNQVDIGNAIKPFYGDDAGNKLTALLKDHILIAADVVTSAKMNDKAKLDASNKRWFANADDISKFLSTANPNNWKYEEVRMHMHEHLKLTTEEAVAQLKGDWSGSIRSYDKVHTQILAMADALSGGIMNQFPEKFQAQGSFQQSAYQSTRDYIEVRAENYRFVPDTITVRRGQDVRIKLYNDADHKHNITFSVDRRNYSLSRDLMQGESGDMRFRAPAAAGRYQFWCPVGDHANRGMRGTLIVE